MLDRLQYDGASAGIHFVWLIRHRSMRMSETLRTSQKRSRTYLVVLAVDDALLSWQVGAVAGEGDEIRTIHFDWECETGQIFLSGFPSACCARGSV